MDEDQSPVVVSSVEDDEIGPPAKATPRSAASAARKKEDQDDLPERQPAAKQARERKAADKDPGKKAPKEKKDSKPKKDSGPSGPSAGAMGLAAAAMAEFRKEQKGKKTYTASDLATLKEYELHTNFVMVPDLAVQCALGRPGFATRRIGELLGAEGCGKTTHLYWLCRVFADAGGICAMIETEDAVSASHARTVMGPHYDMFSELFFNARTLDKGLQMVVDTLDRFDKIDPKGKIPKVLVYDSIAGASIASMSGTLEVSKILSVRMAEKAAILKPFLEYINGRISDSNALLIFGNHGKEKIERGFAATIPKADIDKVKGEGGKSMDFFATYWDLVKRGAAIKDSGGNKIGFQTKHTFKKNKLREPLGVFTSEVDYRRGVVFERPTVDLLYAFRNFGIEKVKGPKFWCDERGIGSEGKPLGYIDFYEAAHDPEHLPWFMSFLDIEMPPLTSQVHMPLAWGDRTPDFSGWVNKGTRPAASFVEEDGDEEGGAE